MKKCIFVIDMVNGFVKEGAMHDQKIMKIVEPIQTYLNENQNERIIFIADSHEKDAIEFVSFPSHCTAGSHESEIIDELKPWAKEVVTKNSTNAFHALDIQALVKEYDEFIMVGCCSDICVMQFALAFKTYLNHLNLNKRLLILKDCVATFDAPTHVADVYHEFALKIMEESGIQVI